MRQRFKPRQAEEAARALDGVDQAEDVIQDLGVVRLLLELHQLIVDGVQALAGLRQKLPQQIIHELRLTEPDFDAWAAPGVRRRSAAGSLDNPFHGPVNFSLRANTDIEDKFALRDLRQRPSAKAAPHLTRQAR
ncbi:hypothetical protein ABIF64_001653 [Bradyrhizobium japonicum]